MKQIGKHQNVLSFVGCWTTTKPLFLVIEYVAHGDLRQWLISKRRQVTLNIFLLTCYCFLQCWQVLQPGYVLLCNKAKNQQI